MAIMHYQANGATFVDGGVILGVLTVAGGYLLGSVLPAVWFVKRQTGKTPWEMGDNPGAAGVWRMVGPQWAVFTAAFDIGKGTIPVVMARCLNLKGLWLAASACAPVVGHNWSLFYGFQGGRGLATATGALLNLSWGEIWPAYILGILIAYWRKWAPAIGIVAFPVGLTLMLARSVDSSIVLAGLCVVLVVLLRQVPWLVSRAKRNR